ncbi:MAG: hypothetical protein ACE5DN_05070, partial [Flavobacteriales bacterium]
MFVIETDTFWNSGQDSMWDIYLAKYDQDGNYLWALQGLDSGWDHVQAVVSDLAGNALIIGSFCSCDTFVFGTDTLDPVGNNPFFLIKIDPNGNVLWSKSFG